MKPLPLSVALVGLSVLIGGGLYIEYLHFDACLNVLKLPWWACFR